MNITLNIIGNNKRELLALAEFLKAVSSPEKEIAKNPFEDDPDAIPSEQLSSIAALIKDSSDDSTNDQYQRRLTDDRLLGDKKRIQLCNKAEIRNMMLCCNILADECKAGGINIVGYPMMLGATKARVHFESADGVSRSVSMTRVVNNKAISIEGITQVLGECMKARGITAKYHSDYTAVSRNKTKSKLARDE